MNKQATINWFHTVSQSGEIYDSNNEQLLAYQHELEQKLITYNQTSATPAGLKKRQTILQELVGTAADNLVILPPVYANSGLSQVQFGKNVFVNFNCTFVDDGPIEIGDDCMIGPSVNFATAIHPISPRLRRHKLQYNKPIKVGRNVWIGANATILPGVTIGDNAIVGGGSVVTKDVAANTIVVGNPAHLLRQIQPEDDAYYDHGQQIPTQIKKTYGLDQ